MLEAVMFWNEPNNKSHWDFVDIDPDWKLFANMTARATNAVASINPSLPRVLGGISPIDPGFIQKMEKFGVLDQMSAVAVHGFPLDWNHWNINEWPNKIASIEAVTDLPIWVSEVGVSTFGADEVQVFGLDRTAELLTERVPRVHWYSLLDLPRSWTATTRHREAEGSSYYRHFYMGLIREDGTPKPAFDSFSRHTPEFGICQWFHMNDPRLAEAVRWLRELGVVHLRTGLSWADAVRPGGIDWLDQQMEALAEFQVTATFCFTPEAKGIQAHHTSAPRRPEEFAEFCASMVSRYSHKSASPLASTAGLSTDVLTVGYP